MIKLTVPEGQDGSSLRNCILDMVPGLRQSDVLRLLRKGDVRLNGERQKKDIEVLENDRIELYLPEELSALMPELEIVYEDENLFIVNKQPGISCIADKDDGKPTLYTLARDYMIKTGEYSVDTLCVPYLCHRLDHNTGGLVMIAKSQVYFELISQAIRERRIRKFYRAVVVGVPEPPEADLHDYLEKDARASKVKVVRQPNKSAVPIVTRYRLLEENRRLSLLEVELITGRTHQIRAHLASVGYPILGDDKYGNRKVNKEYGVRYQALWAVRLIFEVGTQGGLCYLNRREFVTTNVCFPEVGLDVCQGISE